MTEREQLIADLKRMAAMTSQTFSTVATIDRAIAALQQPTPNPWKEAVIDELVMTFAVRNEHENNPRQAVKDAIEANVKIALDPQVSEAAQDLYDKGFAAALSEPARSDEPVAVYIHVQGALPELVWMGEPVKSGTELFSASSHVAHHDARDAEVTELRTLLEIARPLVESQAQAERMLDGFGKRKQRPIDDFLERIDAAIAAQQESKT